MKKSVLALGFFCAFCIIFTAFPQNEFISFINYGKCKEVLLDIRKQVKSDSLAVEYFKENYKIINFKYDAIFKKNPSEVIKYFNSPQNENLYCRCKFDEDPILLQE